MIRFTCPHCGAESAADDSEVGRTARCPKCPGELIVPAALTDPGATVEVAPCPGCTARLAVAPGNLGADVACPYCATVFEAHAVGAAPPEPVRSRRAEEPERRYRRRNDEDDPPRRSRRRGRAGVPGEVQAIGGMLLGGGIYALVQAAGLVAGSSGVCCLWPGTVLALVWGVLAVVRGAAVLNRTGPRPDSPRTLLILQILLVLNFDVVNCVLGVVGLVLLGKPDVQAYFDRYSDGG